LHDDNVLLSITNFVRGRIRSVTQLEILLLLFKHPDRTWSGSEVNAALSNSETSIRAHLEKLVDTGLVAAQRQGDSVLYRFNKENEKGRGTMAELAENYQRWRFRIIEAIYAPQNSSLENFSDSFRIKKEDRDV
jgi:DNA-binding transcriptional ArsR family regulator